MNYTIEKVTTKSNQTRYEVRIWFRGRKAKQVKRRFTTRTGAANFIDEVQALERRKALTDDLSSRTFGEEYQFWRSENSFAPGWIANIEGYWKQSKEALEHTQLSKLEQEVRELKLSWHDAGNSLKTINNKLGFIHAVLNFSVLKRRISVNPLGTLVRGKSQDPDVGFWNREEAEGFLHFLNERLPLDHGERWRFRAVLMTLNTGMRAGEVWGAQKKDLKPELGVIRVVRQFNRVSKRFAELKGKEARSVPLNAALMSELQSQGLGSDDLLFGTKKKPIDHDVFREWFDKQVKDWGGKKITFHELRHTAATLMLLAGIDVKSLQAILGHKNISTTMRYVHALGESARIAGEKFTLSAPAALSKEVRTIAEKS